MRRAIPFLLVLGATILAACSDVSAPRRDDDPNSDGNGGCRSGYTLGSGHTCVPVDG